ncbi:hypothetical protein [Streptomyces sp. NPDC059063]|uniref:hypothetical protein n=1 Tax=unclassified Streptomyces TaxID=2593676 RepID=UPI00367D70DB
MAVGGVLCAVTPPGPAHAAETPPPYAFAADAQTVQGAPSSTGSRTLAPGSTYKSSIKHPGTGTTELYYRLELDARENVYVSATALPGPGSRVGFADGIKVSVQDADGFDCDSGTARFGASRSPRPLTASALRDAGTDDSRCARAGTYYVVVERTASSRASVSDSTESTEKPSTTEEWDLELHVASEPALVKQGATTPPQVGDSASPTPPAGRARPRAGGSSFSTARALTKGAWDDRVKPGETRYYRVPVDWGQRLSATVELGGSDARGTGVPGTGTDGSGASGSGRAGGSAGDREYVTSALVVGLFNPARGPVEDLDTAYDGRQRSAALPALPPVAYENRYAPVPRVSEVRFAGWYYLAVHLDPDVAARFGDGPLGLTLRVDVAGEPRPGPAYVGTARPADEFGVTERDEDAARDGTTREKPGRLVEAGGGGSGDADEAMKVVAAAGIGTGTVLIAVLGVWTWVARRRARRIPA